MSPVHALGVVCDELIATLSTASPAESESARSAVRTFVTALRAGGATPEKTIIALKATLMASWPPDWNMPARKDARAALVSLCIDQYFQLASHEPTIDRSELDDARRTSETVPE